MLSRTTVANYSAEVILAGDKTEREELVKQLAAWLQDNGRSRQAIYLAKDIAKLLADKGYVLVTLTTSHPLDSRTKQQVTDYLESYYSKDAKFEVIELIDKSVIGGVLIDTPNGVLDVTVKNKLMTLIKGA